MAFRNDTIRLNAAIRLFPQFNIQDKSDTEGSYTADYFGEVLRHKNLTDLCKDIEIRLYNAVPGSK